MLVKIGELPIVMVDLVKIGELPMLMLELVRSELLRIELVRIELETLQNVVPVSYKRMVNNLNKLIHITSS